jgi:5-methyltetrahydrofolate--homocysteine methyltransferase
MISERIFKNSKNPTFTIMDGALGTMLQAQGLQHSEAPEDWNITRPETVLKIHRDYANAGADIICANTFGANALKYHGDFSIEQTITSGIELAREAAGKDKYVALDIGPTGRLLSKYPFIASPRLTVLVH